MKTLRGRHILILEDEYFLAEELEEILSKEGASVAGPYPSLQKAQETPLDQVDGAILNVRLRDGLSYPLAQRLRERGIPFVFASGQERSSEPKEWHDDVWVAKPYEARKLIEALHRVMGVEKESAAEPTRDKR